jgi:hypothetical protein
LEDMVKTKKLVKRKQKPVSKAAPPAARGGRPSKFSEKVAQEICERMIAGEDMVAICDDPNMPSRSAVYAWMQAHDGFRAQCAHAREGLADVFDSKIGELIENCTPASSPADRVKLAGLQWRAAKAAPKKYGDRQAMEHSGPDGGPMQFQPVINLLGKPDPKDET